MPAMNPSLCIGPKPLVFLPPCSNGKSHESYYPARASMQPQSFGTRLPSLKSVGTRAVHPLAKSQRSVFACNAALNAKCSQGQTQTVTRESPTITQAPTHGKEKSPMLDDGGSGFPPRDDGGGGGGGGGGESFSGGFALFGFLMFMGYLKDLEGDHENSR